MTSLVTCGGSAPNAASAQVEAEPAWAVAPLLGFGVIRVEGSWNSGGAEAALELEYRRAAWRWSGYASARGLGVACSEACFDGGPAVAIGVSRSIGSVWLGGGTGFMNQFGRWRPSPFARLSLTSGRYRFDVGVEAPLHDGSGVYHRMLFGIPLTVRSPR